MQTAVWTSNTELFWAGDEGNCRLIGDSDFDSDVELIHSNKLANERERKPQTTGFDSQLTAESCWKGDTNSILCYKGLFAVF